MCGLRTLFHNSPLSCDVPANLFVENEVFLNRGCIFEGNGQVKLADSVQVGPNTVFATSNHVLETMAVVHGDIEVRDHVWIGANVTIVQNVTLGPIVIVAAGSVVTKSFANCTIGGVPARVLKQY